MSVRIRSTQTKAISVVITYVLGLAASASISVVAGVVAGVVFALVCLVASVVFFTRTFRGESEDVASPRDWWRMTERPNAGFTLALLFVAQAVYLTVAIAGRENDSLIWATVAVNLVLAVAFLNSSTRLTLRKRQLTNVSTQSPPA